MEIGRRSSRTPARAGARWYGSRLTVLNVLLIVVIAVLDAITPAGVVVGVLLLIPIIASSWAQDPREVWVVVVGAVAAFAIAAALGQPPLQTTIGWLINRMFVVLALAMAGYVSLLLQRGRLASEAATRHAVDEGEVNRLLMSLIAHDLRSPLVTALGALEFLERARTEPDENEVIRESRGRLRRSIRVLDAFLTIARSRTQDQSGAHDNAGYLTRVELAQVVAEEVRAFEPEAQARAKRLVTDFSRVRTGTFVVDILVLRQVLTILVDNAIRYAVPGRIRIEVRTSDQDIWLTVADEGPAHGGGQSVSEGAGLGLQLCSALVRRARGELQLLRDRVDGTAVQLRLPLRPST